MSLTDQAHQIIIDHFIDEPKKLAVDATCGNGHDTLFLCDLGFESVVAFDIQEKAIEATNQRLNASGFCSATTIHTGHERIAQHVSKKIDCAMFNFGYLPKSDKSLTTQSSTSLSALRSTSELLSDSGLITMMCYPGHSQGKQETGDILAWLKTLDNTWRHNTHLAESPKPTAPILFSLKRGKA